MDAVIIESAIQQIISLWKFNKLRPKQLLVIHSFCNGNDVFVALPTGSGKSLCYWILPSLFKILFKKDRSTIIVISPLDALMKDQETSISQLGVKAIVANDANEDELEHIKEGLYEVIFVSPERLLTHSDWRDMLQSPVYQAQLDGIIIDEAPASFQKN